MLLINISGLEGTGKSSASKAVSDVLKLSNTPCITTREPGGTPIAEKLRDLVKHFKTEERFDPVTELLLFYAARNQLFKNVIIPHLNQGNVVIADRSYFCSFAYQVRGSNVISEEQFWAVHNVVMKDIPEYDLIIHLYTDTVEEGLARARGRGELDRIEQNEISFFKRADEGYREIFKGNDNVLSINTSTHNEDEVRDIITKKLTCLLNLKSGI